MNEKFGKDFTKGSIPKQLLLFSLPILLANLITTGYSIVNAAWVGNLLGGNAVGAIAEVFPVMMIMVALISGATTAVSILIARYYGSDEYESIQKIVNSSWTLGLLVIALVSVTGYILSGSIMEMIGAGPELQEPAAAYLRITFITFIFMYLSNLVVAILRGIGDSITPMIFMVLSTVINAVLDPVLITGAGLFPGMGLNGTAYASLISMGLATISGLVYIKKKYKRLPINLTRLELDKAVLGTIIKIGFPAFIQQSLVSIGSAFVVSFVNGFGMAAIAAYGITNRIDSIAVMPAMAVFMAVSTVTAQNIGANKFSRIKDIFKWGIVLNTIMILVISALLIIFSGNIMNLFVRDKDIISIGVDYLAIVASSYILFAVSFISNGIINGSGKTVVTMVFSIVSICIIRIPAAWVLSCTSLGIKGIWVAIAVSYACTTVLSLIYYFSGRWNSQAVKQVGTAGVL